MCTADDAHATWAAFGGPADALRMVGAALDYLNSGRVAGLDGPACGELLIGLAEIQAKLTAAHAGFLRRFDAAGSHDADGYGSSSAWQAGMSKKAARTSVRQMRQLGARPLLGSALAAGDITDSLAFTIADWTRKLPAEMREETDRILVEAAAAGASLDDNFDDRYVQAGTTFGGAGVIRGNLMPGCAAAVHAVLEALGKKAGPEDDRTGRQRFHDALQLACAREPRVCVVPGLLAGPSALGPSERVENPVGGAFPCYQYARLSKPRTLREVGWQPVKGRRRGGYGRVPG
jgi:hypothetical protein